MRSWSGIQGVDKPRGLYFLDQRIVEKVLGLGLFYPGAFGHIDQVSPCEIGIDPLAVQQPVDLTFAPLICAGYSGRFKITGNSFCKKFSASFSSAFCCVLTRDPSQPESSEETVAG